jgi:ATP-dependent protease ClpP protease subunit
MAKKFDLKLKGTVGYWDFNKNVVDQVLDKMHDQEVHVLIDSLGGSVADALSISSAFANHGNVHVHYRGMNASAATISSMGAKHISIDASALYLVHKCSFLIFEWDALNADELLAKAEEYKKKAADAEKIDITIATMYAKRCKKPMNELKALMAEDKWLTAQEAKEWGFVDEIIDECEQVHLTASVATAMASEGMPVPEGIEVEADGFIARIVETLTKVFGKKDGARSTTESAPVAAAAPPVKENTNPIQSVMKKNLVFVAAILAAIQSTLPEANEEGKYPLEEPALDALEKALADADKAGKDKDTKIQDLEKQIADQKAAIDAKDARIKELEAMPAAKTQEVIDNGTKAPEAEESPQEQMYAAFSRARKMMNGEA